MIPATSGPKFANSGYDPGYETTRPGARSVFYNASDADPAVIALDERLKQTGTPLEAVSAGVYPLRTADRNLRIPSFTVNGDRDPFFCDHAEDGSSSDALAAFERQFHAPGAVVTTRVFRDGGTTSTSNGWPPRCSRRCWTSSTATSATETHRNSHHPDGHLALGV